MTEDNDVQQVGYLKIIKASLQDKDSTVVSENIETEE